jgi:hypothetical protein
MLLFVLQTPPPLCKWFHWIDTEQPDWARQEIEKKHRRAWATFFEEERHFFLPNFPAIYSRPNFSCSHLPAESHPF